MLIPSRPHRLLCCLAWLLASGAEVRAQTLPSGPVRALDGRVTLGGEVVVTAGDADQVAFFNYTDYEHNALRMVRLGLSGVWQPSRWIAMVGEVRSENVANVTPYAAYVRLHPWRDHRVDIQAGRIPPTFGAFGRRAYGTDNPLIGYPLAYQYLTSLRSDDVPATADDLLRMRARGWRSSFPIGNSVPGPGLPLVSAFRWDTGVQVRWASDAVQLSGAVTTGTLSSPRVADDNGGKQLSGRIAVTPAVGLILGASVARGPWLAREVPRPGSSTPMQSAAGADVEYSRDHWLVRGELVWCRWDLPYTLTPSNATGVGALAGWAEGRYRLTPHIFVAGRLDRVDFSSIHGTLFEGRTLPWDAPVHRIETGVGYYLQRNLLARVDTQANWRAAGRVRQRTYFSAQLSYWF